MLVSGLGFSDLSFGLLLLILLEVKDVLDPVQVVGRAGVLGFLEGLAIAFGSVALSEVGTLDDDIKVGFVNVLLHHIEGLLQVALVRFKVKLLRTELLFILDFLVGVDNLLQLPHRLEETIRNAQQILRVLAPFELARVGLGEKRLGLRCQFDFANQLASTNGSARPWVVVIEGSTQAASNYSVFHLMPQFVEIALLVKETLLLLRYPILEF